jgi:hypothetical protein
MKAATSSACSSAPISILRATVAIFLAVAGATSCGSGAKPSETPPLSGNTQVTVVLTSTANDRVTEFDLEFQNLLLSSRSGRTVNLLAVRQPSEFIHLNGDVDPLATTTVPQRFALAPG